MDTPDGQKKTTNEKPKTSSGSTTAKTAPKKATPASGRVCQAFAAGNQRFKAIKLGPLWWTTENMNKAGFVNWLQARDICPNGWRLPCTREVEHLIHEFYSNPDKAYTYLTSDDPRNCEFGLQFTGFAWVVGAPTSNPGQVSGFWCMDDFGPTSTIAGSYVFRKNDRAIEILPNTDKSMGLNCRCVKESDAYKRSSLRFTPCVGMP